MINFSEGTREEYDALEIKDSDTLYFITDENKIYKGSTLYATTGGVLLWKV